MRAQRLRQRVTFAMPNPTQDDWSGDAAIEWVTDSDMSDIPAEVLTGPGKEAITGGAKHADAAARINLRYLAGLDSSWRVTWLGTTYDIIAVSTDVTGLKEHRLVCGTIGDGT